MIRSPWFRHGFLNTMEHGITRVADAGVTFVLIWALPIEVFSRLALAQAWVAPLLLFFVAPETVLYRDFSAWREEGRSSFASKLKFFRLFGWGKGQLALILSAVLPLITASEAPWYERFWTLTWAFALALGPQLSGPDREFLRLSLNLKVLNAVTLYQKLSLLAATFLVARLYPARFELLALAAVFSAVSAGILAWYYAKRAMEALPEGPFAPVTSAKDLLTRSLTSFSIWNHLSGVLLNWVQTMDVFVLGWMRFPLREVGLYATALKFANFSTALPLALTNAFGLWTGRKKYGPGERGVAVRVSFGVAAIGVLQALVLGLLAPWFFSVLSQGRWSADDQARMVRWLYWFLAGLVFMSSAFVVNSWLILRADVRMLFFRVYLPWAGFALAAYGIAARIGGLDGTAMLNVGVGLAYVALLAARLKKAYD